MINLIIELLTTGVMVLGALGAAFMVFVLIEDTIERRKR